MEILLPRRSPGCFLNRLWVPEASPSPWLSYCHSTTGRAAHWAGRCRRRRYIEIYSVLRRSCLGREIPSPRDCCLEVISSGRSKNWRYINLQKASWGSMKNRRENYLPRWSAMEVWLLGVGISENAILRKRIGSHQKIGWKPTYLARRLLK